MKKAVIYVHGKGGSADESVRYEPLFPLYDVIGFDYKSEMPWDAVEEFDRYYSDISGKYDGVILVANSIGAYFSLISLCEKDIEKSFLISPIVDMEKLISDMMTWAGVSEEELRREKRIETTFGETLSYDYLEWVRSHPYKWGGKTFVLYGSGDNLQNYETVKRFCDSYGAGLTVMENGEHWFHTEEELAFLDNFIKNSMGEQEILCVKTGE